MKRRTFLLGLGALPACVGSGLEPSPTHNIPRRSLREASSPRGLARPGEVPILLVDSRGRDELAIVDTARGATTFLRAGDQVLASDGRVDRQLELTPRTARTGLTWEGRVYPGRFLVRPRPSGGLELVNLVDLEDYVEGVVSAELALWSAEHAELAAQAVCVRTYALSTLQRRLETTSQATLFDTTLDQAYRGRHRPGDSNHAQGVARRLRGAVEATRGQVLKRLGRLEDARFHASCGGRTASLPDVFANAPSGPPPVDCPPCLGRAAAERAAGRPAKQRPLGWSRTFSSAELARAATNLDVGSRLLRVTPVEVDRGGRWLRAEVRGSQRTRVVRLDALRAAFGSAQLKGSLITGCSPEAGGTIQGAWTVRGRGRGHGVGLCQEGTRDLAREGFSFERILGHYYPGSNLERLA